MSFYYSCRIEILPSHRSKILNNLSLKNQPFRDNVLAILVSEEPNVRNVVQKVALGEADAGIVYRTDATTANAKGNIYVIEFPNGSDVGVKYPIAVLKDSGEKVLARKFLDFVISEPGQSIMADHGFSTP